MRPLAIARFRLWTTIRAATPLFVLALAPFFFALLPITRPQATFFEEPDMWLQIQATAAVLSWVMHGLLMVGITHEFGGGRAASGDAAPASDLMDSAPVEPRQRFLGEWAGIMMSALVLHACCLPVMTLAATVSPLPARVFLSIEAAMLAALILASASAAWRRVGPRVTPRTMRAARTTLLFLMLLMFIVLATTERVAFRDAALAFLFGPSMRAWARVTATVNDPALMFSLLAVVYFGYLMYFYVSASRVRAAA